MSGIIREALEFLVGLKPNNTYQINGDTYSDRDLVRIPPHVYRPAEIRVGSLDGIVKLVENEKPKFGRLFIRVVSPTEVEVYTELDEYMGRNTLYEARCVDASFQEGWRDQQAAIIELRSRFLPTEDSAYLLDLLSRIDNEESVSSTDNGVSQTVTAKQGVALKATEPVRPRLTLRPFRCFREVEQPESEFILRLDEQRGVGLMEADGGIWKMEAKDNIAAYLTERLEDLVDVGCVVIMV